MNTISIIGLCFSGVMMLATIITFIISRLREGKHDIVEESKDKEEMKASLLELKIITKTINQNTTDIKADVKALSTDMNTIDKRVFKVENEQVTMWKKIDELKEKVGV